ncbi:MAG: glycosyltransferase family 2 protein [Anaerolineae bacterium]|nr:glycosyltransferase family 2 protein [Chloroflexota bacterium]MBP6297866.1 glycosyltransferase family 2 protein [Anaerolineae bacterium]
MDISVIIVSWNVAALLKDCLTSLYAADTGGRAMEVIVVDSASTDSTVEMLRSSFPQVMLLAQDENVGFTRANNIGLGTSTGRHILLLNPDTKIIGDALSQMSDFLDSHPDVGVVGPHTLNPDGTTQSSRRRFPDRRTAFFETPWLQHFAPGGLLTRYEFAELSPDMTHEVDWMQGSCLCARREVYDQIGGLDTGYIMYFEELDWCKRAKDSGWKLQYLGSARIVHHGGKSTDQIGARKHIHYNESKLRYFSKVYGRGFATVLRMFLLATYGWQLMLEWIKGLAGSKRQLRHERVTTYWQVLRSGLRVR